MLETEIKNNTAALAALAAAVADLTATLSVIAVAPRAGNLSEIPNSSPTPAPVVAPAAPVVAPAAPVVAPAAPVVAPAPAAGDDQRDLRARAGAAGLSAGDVNLLAAAPAPVSAAPAAMTGDELRKLCVRAGAAGLTAEVVQFLSDHGVTKLAALPPADYPALVALLNSKGVQ